jgi:alcohol dehydrogenase class IV
MGVPVEGLSEAERPEALPRALISLMRDVGMPSGLSAIGYNEQDVRPLVEGTLRQPRLLAGAPRPTDVAELDWILRDAIRYW